MSSTTASLQISLDAAKLPATYANQGLDFISAVVQQILGSQLPSHEDIKEIFKALSHGPFLTPISSITPHSSQRPINSNHINTLIEHLLGADMRKDYPAFIFVPAAEWEAQPSPPLEADVPISSIPTFNPSKAISLTHGHRFHALSEASKGPKENQVKLKYGENLLWVTFLLPDSE